MQLSAGKQRSPDGFFALTIPTQSGVPYAGGSRAHLDVDRYVRVEQRNVEQAAIQENEVRIMAAGKMRNYISYATALVMERERSFSTPAIWLSCFLLVDSQLLKLQCTDTLLELHGTGCYRHPLPAC